ADITRFGQRGSVPDSKGHIKDAGQSAGQERFAAAGRADEEDIALVHLNIAMPLVAQAQPLVMVVHGNREKLFRSVLANDILIELVLDRSWGGNVREESLGNTPAALLLVDDGLAKLDALAADVDVARPFDQGADIPIALATEGAVGRAVSASSVRG